jgi:LAO/AO transport system kinase
VRLRVRQIFSILPRKERVPMSVAGQPQKVSLDAYIAGVRAGDRAMLARAITLIESSKGEHAALAEELLQRLLPLTGGAIRVGITGVPGAGKSTAIDQLGVNLIAQGHRVAVLAVDPTSTRSGGSILADKTRMARLAQSDAAFIRPSPTSGTLGGVARKTRETMALLEAAGFDVVLVETVGVGQSEIAVAGMVDFFLVLLLAGGGDEFQGIKRGIIEIADMLAITKADGDNRARVLKAAAIYQGALAILTPPSPNWTPPVMTISAQENRGLDELWGRIMEHRRILQASGEFSTRRGAQAVEWMRALLAEQLQRSLQKDPEVEKRVSKLEEEVRAGRLTPALAAKQLAALMGMRTLAAPGAA